jgi:hypothetical protein
MLSGKMGDFTPKQKETLENIHTLLNTGIIENNKLVSS